MTQRGLSVLLAVSISLVSINDASASTAKTSKSSWNYGKGVTSTMQNEKSEITSSCLKKPFGLLADKFERILLDLLESYPGLTRNLIDEDIEVPLPTIFGYGTGSIKGKIKNVEISNLEVKNVPKLGASKGFLTVDGKLELLRLTGDWSFSSRISNFNGQFDIHAYLVDYRLVGKIMRPGKDERIRQLLDSAARTNWKKPKEKWTQEKITSMMDSLKFICPMEDNKIDDLMAHLSDVPKPDQEITSLIAKLKKEDADEDKRDAEKEPNSKPTAPAKPSDNELRAVFNVTECGIRAKTVTVSLSGYVGMLANYFKDGVDLVAECLVQFIVCWLVDRKFERILSHFSAGVAKDVWTVFTKTIEATLPVV